MEMEESGCLVPAVPAARQSLRLGSYQSHHPSLLASSAPVVLPTPPP